MDVLTPEQRRLNMSRIRGRDTKPELCIRRGLHRRGLRFRLHAKHLPGKPDLVFPKYGAVIFIHGCFWHGHACGLFKLPATHTKFWKEKIERNCHRDRSANHLLRQSGWRVLLVWECSLRGSQKLPMEEVLALCEEFLFSACESAQVPKFGRLTIGIDSAGVFPPL